MNITVQSHTYIACSQNTTDVLLDRYLGDQMKMSQLFRFQLNANMVNTEKLYQYENDLNM